MSVYDGRIREWVSRIFTDVSSKKVIHGLYFGISEIVDGYEMRCTGSKRFSRTDEDWPCIVDFVPTVAPLLFDNSTSPRAHWTEVLASLKHELLQAFNSQKSSVASHIAYAALGFDDGSLVTIYDVTRENVR